MHVFRTRRSHAILALGGSVLALAAGAARADEPVATNVSEVTVIAKAQAVSPTVAPLDALQPTSRVQADFLRNNIIPLASVDDIIKFQTSVWSFNPNGPGIGKAEEISLRGFQDSSGQFNMTFDGIPFGDATDLHHTTSAIFIAHDLGSAEIDRGPGTASTVGKATFGGTVGYVSKPIDSVGGLEAYGTYGSFGTKALGLEFDTGDSPAGKAFFDAQHENTNGFLTGSNESRSNYAAKYTYDINKDTSLTVVGSLNHESQNTTQGATLAEVAQYGTNYGLCANPALQCYHGYQPSHYNSSFVYARLKTVIAGVRLDNTLYDDTFEHDYSESKDASDNNPADNTVTQYNPVTLKKTVLAHEIPGKRADARYNSFGDILRAAVDTPLGELRGGVWVEQQDDHRYSYNTDITTGLPDIGKTGTAYSYLYKDQGTTYEPYIELEWKPLPNLSVVPGFKYTSYTRDVDALINKTVGGPLNASETYASSQPAIALNYRIQPTWIVYAQAAKGFQAPPINTFQVNQLSASLKPEETTNYQAGTTYKTRNWTLSGDVYYIDFDNYLSQQGTAPDTYYVNGGSVIFQGVEVEGQYALKGGFSLYGNYSYNSAKYHGTNILVEEVPAYLAAAGLLYDNHTGPYFSILSKFVGPHYGNDSGGVASAGGDVANSRIGANVTADLALGWKVRAPERLHLKRLTVSVKVSNLFDNHAIADYAGTQSATPTPIYWWTPGRSAFLNLDAKF
jgi:iron complex outermembrane receptor protein